jgi:hypothetical protein
MIHFFGNIRESFEVHGSFLAGLPHPASPA